jgi:hypothetical protein
VSARAGAAAPRSWQDGVSALMEVLRAEGGLLGAAVPGELMLTAEFRPGPAQIAASGPRAEGRRDAVMLAVEAVHAGYELHYRGGAPVLLGIDRDFALLAGDRLYALGLSMLAELEDLVAIAELADVISLSAEAHAAGDAGLADAVWSAGAAAVGWGASPETAAAKARARGGEAGAAGDLVAAARQLTGDVAPGR